MWVKKITVLHKRDECIWCNSCVILDQKHRTIDEEDGKSSLKWAVQKGKTYMVWVVDADEIDATQEAAKACPVQIIQVAT